MSESSESPAAGTDFIRQQIRADLASGRYDGRVVTRFPPEPNGYLHVGHATAICLNFGIAAEFDGRCHLRYDDTNPEKENEEFVQAIQRDVRWLGYDWGEHLYFASDYFERMYACAVTLIEKGLAYVDSQPLEAIREGRGSVTEPGTPSPFRDRSVEENLDLFRRMRAGAFEDGAHVLRGRIDMAHPNMLMRDPVFYRIRHAHHFRQGDAWCIYPLYDYAHCLEDAFEDVTHSVCTIEFENNRELYDWVLENTGFAEPRPHQYEWAGLDLENAVLSKRAIGPLVAAGLVAGWDDPRLATISAYRRRGVPPEAIRRFASIVGVSRSGGRTEEDKFDFAIRETLNPVAPRVMAVLEPLRVVLTNLPEDHEEIFDVPSFPPDVEREGSRDVPFSRTLFIERSDFAEVPPKGFRRLVPGGEVRLRNAYVIRCDEVVKDEAGDVVELRCSIDPDTRGGRSPEGRRVRGTIHWVSADHALPAEVRLYSALLRPLDEGDGETEITDRVNPESLVLCPDALVEPAVRDDDPATRYQFERTGYFWRDPEEGRGSRLVFNRIVALKSTWRGGEEAAEGGTDGAEAPSEAREGSAKVSGPSVKPQIGEARQAARDADPALAERFEAYQAEHGLAPEHADLLTGHPDTVRFFEEALAEHTDPAAVAAWVVTDVRALVDEGTVADLRFPGAALGRLSALVADGIVSRRAAKDVLARMAKQGGDPAQLVEEMGLAAVSDADELGAIIDGILDAMPDKVEAYRSGRKNLLGLFIGEVMKSTKGAADPRAVRTLLTERLDS